VTLQYLDDIATNKQLQGKLGSVEYQKSKQDIACRYESYRKS